LLSFCSLLEISARHETLQRMHQNFLYRLIPGVFVPKLIPLPGCWPD